MPPTSSPVHLFWAHRLGRRGPILLSETTKGLAVCGVAALESRLTLSPSAATCALCRKTWHRGHPSPNSTKETTP